MDLDSALHTCRCGGHIREDSLMAAGWKIYFDPDKTPANMKLKPAKRTGNFFYINPATGPAYEVTFSAGMKASIQWKTVP